MTMHAKPPEIQEPGMIGTLLDRLKKSSALSEGVKKEAPDLIGGKLHEWQEYFCNTVRNFYRENPDYEHVFSGKHADDILHNIMPDLLIESRKHLPEIEVLQYKIDRRRDLLTVLDAIQNPEMNQTKWQSFYDETIKEVKQTTDALKELVLPKKAKKLFSESGGFFNELRAAPLSNEQWKILHNKLTQRQEASDIVKGMSLTGEQLETVANVLEKHKEFIQKLHANPVSEEHWMALIEELNKNFHHLITKHWGRKGIEQLSVLPVARRKLVPGLELHLEKYIDNLDCKAAEIVKGLHENVTDYIARNVPESGEKLAECLKDNIKFPVKEQIDNIADVPWSSLPEKNNRPYGAIALGTFGGVLGAHAADMAIRGRPDEVDGKIYRPWTQIITEGAISLGSLAGAFMMARK